ncbi:MFS transporter [Bacteroidales bacterium OttesenSCG-928-B11]|nr:MFS transporter [Bacteroidales bacterium OttesenSCG-928-B11]
MTTERKNYTLPIIMMILLFGMISFVTNLAAPIGVIWKSQPQFEGSNFLGMLGNLMNFIAYAIMGIPAGKLLSRLGYKKTALLSIALGFAGVFIQFLSGVFDSSNAFVIYLIGAFIAGFSMCGLNTVVNPMLNTLGGGGNKGNQLIQIGGTFNSLTGTLTPMLVGALIGEVTKSTVISDVNPVLFIAMSVFALVFIVLSLVRIPEPHLEKTVATTQKSEYSAWSFRHFVLGAIAIFIYVGIEVGIPGTMMYYLADAEAGNMGASVAGFVAGTYWFLMLIGRFIGAAIGGKISSKTMLTVASALGVILVVAGMILGDSAKVAIPAFTGSSFEMVRVPIAAMFFVLCGLCTSVMWGGIFNLAVEGLGKYVTAASGIFMMMVCGGGILPLIQNAIADGAGYMASYWVPVAGFVYLLYYAFIGSKNVNKDIPV